MSKMLSMVKFVILVLFLSETKQEIRNIQVERTIDLSTQLVRINLDITIRNDGPEAINTYILLLEYPHSTNVSFVTAKSHEKGKLDIIHSEPDTFQLHLGRNLATGEIFKFRVETLFTRILVSYPNSIKQHDKHLVRYFGNHFFYSPYFTDIQNTDIAINSTKLIDFSKLWPTTRSMTAILYGPYRNIPPKSYDKMVIHFDSSTPFLTVTYLERYIEVSHWGKITIQENFKLLHTGAKLKGPFERTTNYVERHRYKDPSCIKGYMTFLPSYANNVFYKDTIGHIFSYELRQRGSYQLLALQFRFPLYGGWKTSHTVGYDLPTYPYLFRRSSKNKYVLNIRLLDHVFNDMLVEELRTFIILPVGATEITVVTPYEVERKSDGKNYKYLDFIGRPVIEISKKNAVEEHIQNIKITYSWNQFMLLYEPILITLALILLFWHIVFALRIDFSLPRPEEAEEQIDKEEKGDKNNGVAEELFKN